MWSVEHKWSPQDPEMVFKVSRGKLPFITFAKQEISLRPHERREHGPSTATASEVSVIDAGCPFLVLFDNLQVSIQ